MKSLAAIMLAGVAIAAIVPSAQAQIQTPGWYGELDGMYALKPPKSMGVDVSSLFGSKVNVGDGWGVAAKTGYRFAGRWDLGIGGSFTDFSKGSQSNPAPITSSRATDGRLWTVDGDFGYTFSGPGYGLRPFIGARYFNWRFKNAGTASVAPNVFSDKISSWGVGPRAGLDGTARIAGPVSFFAGIDGAVMFGKIKDNKSFPGTTATNGKNSRTTWNVGGRAGLDWEVAPLVHLAAGYKVDYYDGLNYDTEASPNAPKGRGSELVHGPFVRLAYNIGAPRAPAPVAAPPPPPKPAPAPVMARSYMVFFEFDRSNLSAAAADTIKQAADAAKAGGSPRVNVTGHADRSGTDQYNMALSLRRANTVRDELVRLGVPAASIIIVARGETAPLVQTPDGAREPQNRRVEIVLN